MYHGKRKIKQIAGYQIYYPGTRVMNRINKKIGTIDFLTWTDMTAHPTKYYYQVAYDDGVIATSEPEMLLYLAPRNKSSIINTDALYTIPRTKHNVQNVNQDERLRKQVIKFFMIKLEKWINNDEEYKKLKKYKKKLLDKDIGYKIIEKLLKLYTKLNKVNWYDLRKDKTLVKEFMRKRLKKYV